MHKRMLLLLALSSVCALGLAVPASADMAAPLAGEWSRLSADQSNPAPEHELLRCIENEGTGSAGTWWCRYSKQPEPGLKFYWNNRQGFFSGTDVTATWSCPAWFPNTICANVVQVVEGTMTFVQPSDGFELSVNEDFIVTQEGTAQKMYAFWIDYGFYCPWFRTFADAVAANPLPLPFDGTWPPQDCVVAP
jgi:hypothetical protein